MASLMVPNGTILRAPVPLSPHPKPTLHSRHNPKKPTTAYFSLLPQKQPKPFSLSLSHKTNRFITLASQSPSSFPTLPQQNPKIPTHSLSTKIFTLSAFFVKCIQNLINPYLPALQSLQSNLVHTAGPLFFAALKDRPSGYLNTPLTVVAAGLAKWLDIYSGVLMVRVLLSWFPNIPWDRQPLSAIRDLCDPYLNLFRNIIPPIFDTLDVSPLLAFAVLGTLGSILNSSRGMY